MSESAGKTLCLMPTFRCTAQCDNCGTFSSPRASGHLSLEEMIRVIEQAVSGGYRELIFTGGEPTLAGEDLLKAMRHAALLGLHIKMVTNAHWATGAAAAARRVHDFVSNGLAEINFSTGDRHAGFIPVENIIYALRAAVAAGLIVTLIIETTRGDSLNRETFENHPGFKAIFQDFPHAPFEILDWVWSPLSPFRLGRYAEGFTVDRNNLGQCGGCDDVLKTTTVQADGTISPCCGLGIRFVSDLKTGNINQTTLSESARMAESDPLKQRIKSEGPERILAWAAEFDKEIKWENMYAHRCQACVRIFKDARVRKVIAEHGKQI